jgi:hypothetical protein
MVVVVLEPRFFEIGPFTDQYDDLVEAMRKDGLDVRVKGEREYRSAGEIARTAYDVAVHLLDEASEELVALVVGYLMAHLKGKAILGQNRGERRRAFIYGPRGEKLSELELPDDEKT